MKFINNSKHIVRVNIYSGFPPAEHNRAGELYDYTPGSEGAVSLQPGDYYVYIHTTNIGKIAPGIVIAGTGGVPSEGTVTITENDRISVT